MTDGPLRWRVIRRPERSKESSMSGHATTREQAGNWLSLITFLLMAVAAVALAGCTRQEKVLDIETPGGRVEVYEERPILE
jgi:hypothetical protein